MRRFRAKLFNTTLTLGVLVAAGYGGLRFLEDYSSPYLLKKEVNTYYLVNKDTDDKQIITEDFQLGSVRYRLEGLLHEPKEQVRDAIKYLE